MLSCLDDEMEPTLGKFLKARLELRNEFDKYAVAFEKCDVVVGHLSKGKPARFAKTISYILRESNEHSCKVEDFGKRVNLADGDGLQIPCKLHFTGDSKHIDKLMSFLFHFLPFLHRKRTKVRINGHIFALGTEKISKCFELSWFELSGTKFKTFLTQTQGT